MDIERYEEIKLEISRLKMLKAKAESKCAKIAYKVYKDTGMTMNDVEALMYHYGLK